jgi:hypothetical protein
MEIQDSEGDRREVTSAAAAELGETKDRNAISVFIEDF